MNMRYVKQLWGACVSFTQSHKREALAKPSKGVGENIFLDSEPIGEGKHLPLFLTYLLGTKLKKI